MIIHLDPTSVERAARAAAAEEAAAVAVALTAASVDGPPTTVLHGRRSVFVQTALRESAAQTAPWLPPRAGGAEARGGVPPPAGAAGE